MNKKLIIFIAITVLMLFSLFELYNLSALYREQNEAGEAVIKNLTEQELHKQKVVLSQLNLWRMAFLGLIVFCIAFYARGLYKLL
jgi:uncharacterized membrane protein SpoIIM required for sporulation